MFTVSFLKATAERMVKTFAQSLAALLLADGTGIVGTHWADRFSVAGMAALLSVLSSVASGGIGGTGPSLANEVISPPAVDPGDAGTTVIEAVLIVLVVIVVLVILAPHFR